ncbi:MAG: glucose-methanol-choline oxidoreductase [Pseudomonadales bacterium]|nr:glucose-methanol-choline oxidoreductase [Pseudomonadales bacterium]
MKHIHDFIIVGSGASGSVIAHELMLAGADVLMLEAGKRFSAGTFPDNELDANAQLMWNGGMDASKDASTLFIRGKVVGGGTIINQCLLDRFDDIAWDSWRSQSGIDFFNSQAMSSHYDSVESHLALHYMEKQDWNTNAELYVKVFEQKGYQWAPLRRGQSDCGKGNDCMTCLGGCPRGSKQSMLETFLPKAEKLGLRIQSETTVREIIHGPSFVTVYGYQQGRPVTLHARKVVLASGALGTTELLLRSQLHDILPALGRGFHCHPQWMTVGMFNATIDSHKGAFQAVKSDEPRFRAAGFKLENVFAGPIAIGLLKPGYGFEHQRFMKQYRNMACIEVAVRDQAPGTIRLNNRDRLEIDKPLSDIDRQKANNGNQLVADMFRDLGANEVMTSPLQIGLHLMGGCSIGQDERQSVVNERFQVHGLRNLYIADSSIFPNAPGINPSLTIMAISHKAAQNMLGDCGVTSAFKKQVPGVANV